MRKHEAKSMGVVAIVQDGRHPFAVLTMSACVISGVTGLLNQVNPNSAIERFVPTPLQSAYYSLLLISGVAVLIAIWLPDIRDRLIWERIGLFPFTGALLVYPLALAYINLQTLGVGAIIGSLFGFGGLWRIILISREIKKWRIAVARVNGTQSNEKSAE